MGSFLVCCSDLSRSQSLWSYYPDLSRSQRLPESISLLHYEVHMIKTSPYLTDLHLLMSGDIESNPGPLDTGIEEILSNVDDTTLGEDDWNSIASECSSLAPKWQQLSAYLGLKFSLIDRIKSEYCNDTSNCWSEALREWIIMNYNFAKFGAPSWRTLLKAVALVDILYFKKLAYNHQVKPCSADGARSSGTYQKPVDMTIKSRSADGASSSDTYQNPDDIFLNSVRSQHLILIKWKNDQGKTERFYLAEKIAHKWRDLGVLLGLSPSMLESLAENHRGDVHACCQELLGRWLESPPLEYPSTWRGLVELLLDCQLGQVAEELKATLFKANV